MNVAVLFDIYRASEIKPETRISLIKKMGGAINNSVGMNLTEPLVYELVLLLDANDPIKDDEHYRKFL